MAAGIRPTTIGSKTRKHAGIEALVASDLAQGEDVANLGKELLPALVRENLSWRPSLHWAAAGDRIGEVGFARSRRRIAEIGMVGEPARVGFTAVGATEYGIDFRATLVARDRHRRLHVEPVQALGELLATVERAARGARGNRGEGAPRQRTQTVLAGQHPARRKDTPANEVAPRDL